MTSVLLVATFLAPPAFSQSPVVDSAHRGMQAFEGGQYAQAIEFFDEALASEPGKNRAAIEYNKALALCRTGDLNQAVSLLETAAGADDRAIAAKARFNLGNISYAAALNQQEQTPEAAIAQLRQAIQHYRSALQLDPGDNDARANIELANRLIQQIESRQAQPEPEPPKNSESNSSESASDSQESESESQPSNDSKSAESGAEDQKNPESGSNADSAPSPSGRESEQQSGEESSDSSQSEAADSASQSGDSDPSEQSEQAEQQADAKGEGESAGEPKPSQQTANSSEKGDSAERESADASSESESKKEPAEGESSGAASDSTDESNQPDSQSDSSADQNNQRPGENSSRPGSRGDETDRDSGSNSEGAPSGTPPEGVPPEPGAARTGRPANQPNDSERSERSEPSKDSASAEPTGAPAPRPRGELSALNDVESGSRSLADVAGQLQEGSTMTREEALKLLQAVRDRDLKRRLEQMRDRQRRRVPVDKDW